MAYAQLAGIRSASGLWSLIVAGVACTRCSGRRGSCRSGRSRRPRCSPPRRSRRWRAATRSASRCSPRVLALVVAAYALVAWAFRLGFVADLLSRPVLIGYLAGVAVIMIVGQLSRIFGVEVEGDTIAAEAGLVRRRRSPRTVSTPPRRRSGWGPSRRCCSCSGGGRALPGPLLAVVVSAGLVTAFSLQDNGVVVVGDIPVGLPEVGLAGVTLADVQSAAAARRRRARRRATPTTSLDGAGVRRAHRRPDRRQRRAARAGRHQRRRPGWCAGCRSAAAAAARRSACRAGRARSCSRW